MSLDVHKAAGQVQRMAGSLQTSQREREQRLVAALMTLADPLKGARAEPLPLEKLAARIEAGAGRKVTWLLAKPDLAQGFGQGFGAPPPIGEYLAIGTDGSQIDVDRHGPAHCFLINIGVAAIRYGQRPAATLFSEPHLYSRPEELAIFREGEVREHAIDGTLLGIKRAVMECEELARRLESEAPGIPVLGLLDGSLVLWELSSERYPEFVREALLDRGFLPALDALRGLADRRPMSFGSYISRPRSTEVVNLLRIAHCPHEALDTRGCERICGAGGEGKQECTAVALGLTDRDLFEEVLEPGQRSPVFASQSSIVLASYAQHRVSFFYLNTGDEIARVETPAWVAEDRDRLDLLHATVLDQCRKGRDYPVVLQEAHEKAVVTMADRRAFWSMVDAALQREGVPASSSLKARSKRLRAV